MRITLTDPALGFLGEQPDGSFRTVDDVPPDATYTADVPEMGSLDSFFVDAMNYFNSRREASNAIAK